MAGFAFRADREFFRDLFSLSAPVNDFHQLATFAPGDFFAREQALVPSEDGLALFGENWFESDGVNYFFVEREFVLWHPWLGNLPAN